MNTIPVQTASGRDETYVKELDGEWIFDENKSIKLPHTWNDKDGETGGNNYVREAYWYRKDFFVEKNPGKRIYIEFLGANQKTEVYVNGNLAGEVHKGGYTAFRYDITELLKNGNNRLEVKVDNRVDQSIAPISADFNMYGGIYRRVFLVTVDDVHLDLGNYGSSGLFLQTENMRSKKRPDALGKFQIKTKIVNDSDRERRVRVKVSVYGTNAPDDIYRNLLIPANGCALFTENFEIINPTLWEGAQYSEETDESKIGYRYTVKLDIVEEGKIIDSISEKIGFRYFWIENTDGFYLNGKKYKLRGVNRHSFMAGIGSAMTEKHHLIDMEIMKELGVNAVRLCHYPQTDFFYDLCDENGIVVWSEIPFVNEIGSNEDFFDVTKNQLKELIRQQYNRPSICFWGLENEIGNGTSLTDATEHEQVKKMKKFIYELDALAKKEDTTGRYTTQAVNRDYSMNGNNPESVNADFANNVGWKSDLVAWNIYPRWYPDANFYGSFEDVMSRKKALDSRPMGISEFGWGGNVNQHEAYPKLGENNLTAGGEWHPEEYQSMMNEEAISYINAHDEMWCTYCWVLFDFAVDARNEGGQVALNDKGLVTADRRIKKDSYYLYKANWNKKDYFTYITSRRWDKRKNGETYIKVYSNCDVVTLFINGENRGKMKNRGNGIFYMDNVILKEGDVEIKTVGENIKETSGIYEDMCKWEVCSCLRNSC